ncbi:MAG TPA: exonuclease SbcCD subunit D [Tepidisphaeraceae bacterium]|jgi:exonuclease SbcD
MRFIHTADWHLGRLFHGVHLTDDQHHALMQLVELAGSERPDAILVAGDIYDRAIPPPEAVELLDEVLCRLVIDLKIPVVLIAGNHDSPQRLNFGARLLANRRLYVTGNLPRNCPSVTFEDAHGPVHVYPLPYAEPMVVRECLACDEVVDHDSAMRALVARIQAEHSGAGRKILMAHAFVAGGAECESERPLSVGGAGTVDASALAGFNYVALGHLHCPQRIGDDAIRYSGSLLKYSFDEAHHPKGVYLIEMDGAGVCDVKTVAITPRRDVRRIEGSMAQLLEGPKDGRSKDDYLEVMVTDDGPVLDAIGRLREVYPNVMLIRRPEKEGGAGGGDRPDIRGKGELELFQAFFRHVTENDLSEQQERAFAQVVERVRQAEREAAPAAIRELKPQPGDKVNA